MKVRSVCKIVRIALFCMLPILGGGCGHFQGGSTTNQPGDGVPSADQSATVPLGQPAGAPSESAAALATANPYEGNAQAIQQGRELYIRMNCAGCHAYTGKGNMGPNLTDGEWRYGGLPIQIYRTIHDGRPQGMPAWGTALPPDEIWKLVAYVQSLGGAIAVSDYGHARQGDKPGEQVAPEAQADAQLAPPPPVETSPISEVQSPSPAPTRATPALLPAKTPATAPTPKPNSPPPAKAGEPQP